MASNCRNKRNSCHNCRRNRLKCDRSWPTCVKCATKGQSCLGYQRLLRWEHGLASRGRMAGLTFEDLTLVEQKDEARNAHPTYHLHETLTDPLIQDLGYNEKVYLLYFARNVCKDLVLYDTPELNRFRQLIPMTSHFPALSAIVLANAALHMSKSSHLDAGLKSLQDSRSISSLIAVQRRITYGDALKAKQQALKLLPRQLGSEKSLDLEVLLAIVLLFVYFELLDSGCNDWTHHVRGARSIICKMADLGLLDQSSTNPLRAFLVSHCHTLDILGATSSSFSNTSLASRASSIKLSLLQDKDGNHCASFPSDLLCAIQAANQLTQNGAALHASKDEITHQHFLDLFQSVMKFDASAWAESTHCGPSTADLIVRTSIARAHRAAVCIYLSRLSQTFSLDISDRHNRQLWVKEIIQHLSVVQSTDVFFPATAWPMFIAGAETTNRAHQDWVRKRFQHICEIQPWGSVKGALESLWHIWYEVRVNNTANETTPESKDALTNWLPILKNRGIDWLIV